MIARDLEHDPESENRFALRGPSGRKKIMLKQKDTQTGLIQRELDRTLGLWDAGGRRKRLPACRRAGMYYAPFGTCGTYGPHHTSLSSRNKPSAIGRLVMKFGGTSVANIERIQNVARHVKREVDAGNEVRWWCRRMAGKTNELVAWCRDASPMHDAREYDAVVASASRSPRASGHRASRRSASRPLLAGLADPIRTSDAHASARILDVDGRRSSSASPSATKWR